MKLGPGHEMECPKCGTVYPQKPGDHGHLDDHPDGYRFMSKDAITVEAVELKKLVLELNRLLALSDTRLRSLRAYVARTAMVPIAYSPERFGCLLCQEQAERMNELKHGPECLLAPVSGDPVPNPEYGGDFEGSDGGPLPAEPGCFKVTVRHNDDGEFGAVTGWVYLDGNVWRPIDRLRSCAPHPTDSANG